MPNLMTDYEHLKTKDTTALLMRREEVKASAPDPKDLSDEALQELLAIARILRTRTVAPKAASVKKVAANLDAL